MMEIGKKFNSICFWEMLSVKSPLLQSLQQITFLIHQKISFSALNSRISNDILFPNQTYTICLSCVQAW